MLLVCDPLGTGTAVAGLAQGAVVFSTRLKDGGDEICMCNPVSSVQLIDFILMRQMN